MTAYLVVPATPERWPDVVSVMGVRGDPSRCWCQYFHLRGKAWSEAATAGGLRDRLQEQIVGPGPDAVAPGLVAYRDDTPVGWCQVGPKASYARLASSPVSAPPTDEPDPDQLWAVTCFVVPPAARRAGVANALLEAALDHAAARGARHVEGYPVDTAAATSVSSAGLYHGTLSMFGSADFVEVRRPSPARVVVRRQVDATHPDHLTKRPE